MNFNAINLGHELDELSAQQRASFTVACCERLLPLAEVFSLQKRITYYEILRHAADRLWTFARTGSKINSAEVTELMKRCLSEAPDTQDCESVLAYGTISAGDATYASLQAYLSNSPHDAARAAQACFEFVDVYLNAVASPDYLFEMATSLNHSQSVQKGFDDWKSKSPLYEQEVLIQQEHLRLLKSQEKITNELITALTKSASYWKYRIRQLSSHPNGWPLS